MRPHPARLRCGSAAWVTISGARTLTAKNRSLVAASGRIALMPMPALLTTPSSRPKCAAAVSTATAQAAGLDSSASIGNSRSRPTPCRAVSRPSASALRSTAATAWPPASKAAVITDPSPPAAPVISTARDGMRRALPLHRRIVAREHRLLQERLGVHGPELADLAIGLHRLVDHLAAVLVDAANVDVDDDVAVIVERDRPARRLCERDGADRLHKGVRIVRLAPGLGERRLDHHAVDIETGRVMADAHVIAVVLAHAGDEALVRVGGDVEGIGIGVDQPLRLVAVGGDDRVVGRGRAADELLLDAHRLRLLDELDRVRAGQPDADRVALGQLRDVGGVVGGVEG